MSQLLADYYDTGGLRPVAGLVNRDDGDLIRGLGGQPLDDGEPVLTRIDARAAIHKHLVQQIWTIVGRGCPLDGHFRRVPASLRIQLFSRGISVRKRGD